MNYVFLLQFYLMRLLNHLLLDLCNGCRWIQILWTRLCTIQDGMTPVQCKHPLQLCPPLHTTLIP